MGESIRNYAVIPPKPWVIFTMNSVSLTQASTAHLKDLQFISRQTFFEAFHADNTPENMKAFLLAEFSEEKLRRELANRDSEFYLLKQNDEVIGYLKINFGNAQTELKENDGMEVERIYLLREFYGKGLGNVLWSRAFEIAQTRKMKYVWLGVWEKNPRAIRFYEKNGFSRFGSHPFKVGDDLQTDILMRFDL